MKKALGQTVRDLKRGVNRKVLKVPELERKVLDATSNEAWGPHGSHLADIAQASRNQKDFQMIMGLLWKRLSDTGKNWRHVYKALIILEYLIANGSERVIDEIKEHAHQITTLSEFQYVDSSGRDQGSNIRRKSQSLVLLVTDKERIQEARQKASANRDKFSKPGGSSPGGYGDRYNEENQNGHGKDDRYGRYGDSSSRDGDRSDRESETRYSRDGSVDDEHQGGGRNIDVQNNFPRNRSAERDGNQADDDGYSSSRGSGVRPDDSSQDGRNENQRYNDKIPGHSPGNDEAVSEGWPSVHSERGGDPSVTVPRPASPPATSSTTHSTTEQGTLETPVANGPFNNDEFDPRGLASASPSVTSNSAEADLIGSLSDSFSADSANMPTLSATDSGSGATFSATFSSFNQPFEDPFGDTPFRATPSTDSNPAQTENPPFFHPTMNQGLELHAAQTFVPQTNALSNFDYGTPFGSVSYTPSAVSHDQFSATNTQIVPSGYHNQEIDILAGLLPPSGFVASPTVTSQETQTLSGQTFQSNDAFGGYHQQSEAVPSAISHLADQSPSRQTEQINNDFFPQQGHTAPLQHHMDSEFATHPPNQLNGGDFFQQLGSSLPASMAPYGQTKPESYKYDGGFLQQVGSNLLATSSITPGTSFEPNTQNNANRVMPQQPGFPLSSSPVASQGQKEPYSQNYNEGFIQHSVSSVPVASHMVSQLNGHHNSGGFIQQQGVPQLAPRVQNYQNPQSFNDELFQQQHTSTATEGPRMDPEFSYSSTAQQIGGGFSQQPGSSQRNPNSNSQQPGSPQIAHQGQTEQNPHQLSASVSPGTSYMGPGSSYEQNAQKNIGGIPQQPASSLGNLPVNPQQPSLMRIAPQDMKEQNPQHLSSGLPHQQSASTAPGAPHIVPVSPYASNAHQNTGGFFQQPGLSMGNSSINPHGQTETTDQNYNGGFLQQKQTSHLVPGQSYTATGQYNGGIGNFLPSSGSSQFYPHHVDIESALKQNRDGLGGMVSQTGSPNQTTSQPFSTAAGPLAVVPQPTKDKFETKSTVWADTLSRGLVNLNISGSKTNPLADIGIDFDAINRKEKRMEKPAATPAVSTMTMGKAMGSGSGIGRSGASALRPSASPTMNSGLNTGIGAGPGFGPGTSMTGYAGMNQQPMGGLEVMNQQQAGGFRGMNQQPMGGLEVMNQQQAGGFGGMNQQPMGMSFGPSTGMRPSFGRGPGTGMSPGNGMGMGMNLRMGQGSSMQQLNSLPPGSSYNGGYNPVIGGGYSSQPPYGGGYR